MAKINRQSLPKTAAFSSLQEVSKAASENNDCVVKAVALASRTSYEEAHKTCQRNGRKQGKGMHNAEMFRAFEESGVTLERVFSSDFISKYPGNHKELKSVTTHHPDRFNKVWADGNRYLFHCKGHVAYVEDGVCHDWTRGRSLRVAAIYRIVDPA